MSKLIKMKKPILNYKAVSAAANVSFTESTCKLFSVWMSRKPENIRLNVSRNILLNEKNTPIETEGKKHQTNPRNRLKIKLLENEFKKYIK